jgi:hypothetical protein
MPQFNYIWNGLKSAPQPSAQPCLGLDYADSILYVASQPTPTSPSVWVPIGGGPNGGPVIQARLQAINTTVPQSLTITSLAAQMYAISLFMETAGGFGSGHAVVATLTWGSPLTTHTITLSLPMDGGDTTLLETYPLLVAAGAPITIQTEYSGGATNDPYTISARLVQMP